MWSLWWSSCLFSWRSMTLMLTLDLTFSLHWWSCLEIQAPFFCLQEVPTWEGSRREEPAPVGQGYSGPLRDTCPVPAVSGDRGWDSCWTLNLQKHTDLLWNHAHHFIQSMEEMTVTKLLILFSTVPVAFFRATDTEKENCFYGNRWKFAKRNWVVYF